MPSRASWWSIVAGFAVIFAIYHVPDLVRRPWAAYVAIPLVLVASDLVARAQGARGLIAYGLAGHPGWARNLGVGLAVGIGFAGLAHVIAIVIGAERVVAVEAPAAWLRHAPEIVVMTLVPSLAEDLLTRGYLYRFLAPRMAAGAWIVLSAAVFVGNHLSRLGAGAPILPYLFAIGLATAWALAYTGSLWAALGLHWGGNLVYLSSVVLVPTETIGPISHATWILAVCDFAMFGACVAFVGRVLRRPGRVEGGVQPA